ncbi:hypothetical protein PAXINDRAFT_100326 [Paxillus involutus ATCC 200175]|uniref:Uncharacterized protein n=1 Tax=Paxillus involutus ATCC 200175 TaxID=664439 RepID=A0A0C9TV34_PAXIN|nr:hypothetical protein PAXINDRAFT_100326 [Paxillus involutus ATCC 200175]
MSYIRQYKAAKHPSAKAVTLQALETTYGATYLRAALARFAVKLVQPGLSPYQQEDAAHDINLPRTLPIFHKIRFNSIDSSGHCDESRTVDAIHAKPGRKDRHGRGVPARFDTALVNLGDGKDTGVKGYRVGQVRTIFTIPQQARNLIFGHANVGVPQHLAYVEWFTPFSPSPEPNHGMYKVTRSVVNGERLASIVPVANIRRSVRLIPKFGSVAPREWTSSNVLELCKTFFVNPFTDQHAYQSRRGVFPDERPEAPIHMATAYLEYRPVQNHVITPAGAPLRQPVVDQPLRETLQGLTDTARDLAENALCREIEMLCHATLTIDQAFYDIGQKLSEATKQTLDTYIADFSRAVEGLGCREQPRKIHTHEHRLRSAKAAMDTVSEEVKELGWKFAGDVVVAGIAVLLAIVAPMWWANLGGTVVTGNDTFNTKNSGYQYLDALRRRELEVRGYNTIKNEYDLEQACLSQMVKLESTLDEA